MGSGDMRTRSSAAPLPLVGRRADRAALCLALDDALDGSGGVALIRGSSGMGKTRLLEALMEDARSRGVICASGRAWALEASRPFGLWADALTPFLASLGDGTTAILARGLEWELSSIVPAFANPGAGRLRDSSSDADTRGRLFWNFSRFITRCAERAPLLVVLDDLHHADVSSRELLHFAARHLTGTRVLLVGSFDAGGSSGPEVQALVRSLGASAHALIREVEPLTTIDVDELLHHVFDHVPAGFAEALHAHTNGVPFFVEEVLKTMGAGTTGGTLPSRLDELHIPTSVRESILARIELLPDEARRLAEVVALAGKQATLSLLEVAAQLELDPLGDALDLLCAREILRGPGQHGGAYTFRHQMVQLAIADGISESRARRLHLQLADAIERVAGHSAAADVVLHRRQGGQSPSASTLTLQLQAGRDALSRRADHEAASWLGDALALFDNGSVGLPPDEHVALLDDAALAYQRIGDMPRARSILQALVELCGRLARPHDASAFLHRLATVHALDGDAAAGIELLRTSEEHAAGRLDLVVRSRVARAMLLQSTGRSADGKALLEESLPWVTTSADAALQARVHRALVLLYAWTGPSEVIEHHAAAALSASRKAGDLGVTWSVSWAMATLAGLRGDTALLDQYRREAERIAEGLHSPRLQVATAEIAIEHASGTGDWRLGLALADQYLPLARAVAQRTVLPRILVWTALLRLGRDERAEAERLVAEACAVDPDGEPLAQVHNQVVTGLGRAALHLHAGEWRAALKCGQQAIELADRHEYRAWSIHRLLPLVAEAALWLQNFTLVEEVAARLRNDSRALGHRLGPALAQAAEALVARLRDRRPDAARLILEAAQELDSIPYPFHAARLRRNASSVLEGDGDREGAVRELRIAHDIFSRLGAESELRGTRSHLRSLGVRLPPRETVAGMAGMTGRELEIARCVARNLSNKEIGQVLDISARTVSTHLSNIFEKLEVRSRRHLTDLMRSRPGMLAPEAMAVGAE